MLLCRGAGKGIELVTAPCSFEHYELGERYMLQDGNFFDFDQSEARCIMSCGWLAATSGVRRHWRCYS